MAFFKALETKVALLKVQLFVVQSKVLTEGFCLSYSAPEVPSYCNWVASKQRRGFHPEAAHGGARWAQEPPPHRDTKSLCPLRLWFDTLCDLQVSHVSRNSSGVVAPPLSQSPISCDPPTSTQTLNNNTTKSSSNVTWSSGRWSWWVRRMDPCREEFRADLVFALCRGGRRRADCGVQQGKVFWSTHFSMWTADTLTFGAGLDAVSSAALIQNDRTCWPSFTQWSSSSF